MILAYSIALGAQQICKGLFLRAISWNSFIHPQITAHSRKEVAGTFAPPLGYVQAHEHEHVHVSTLKVA